MKTRVIVVTYNGMPWIDRCLGSVAGRGGVGLFVTVVDNGSTDGTIEYIRKHFPDITLVCAPTNLGFSKGNNIGIRQALEEQADYVYLLNQDAWVEPDAIQRMIDIHQRHPEYGVLSPMHYNGQATALDRGFANQCNSNPKLIRDLKTGQTDDIYAIPFVMAAHWLITGPCLRTIGELSPLFRFYGEDNNYLHRIHYHGFKLGVCPSAIAYHDRADRPPLAVERERCFYYHAEFLQRVHNINRPLFTRYLFYLVRLSCKVLTWCVQDRSLRPLSTIADGIRVLPPLYKRRKLDKQPFPAAAAKPE